MFEIAMKMIFCLLLAALIGAVIGYIIGRMIKCEKDEKVPEVFGKDDNPPVKQHLIESKTQEVEIEEIKESDAKAETTLLNIVQEESGFEKKEESKPELLDAPRDGKADDLKEISGVGLKLENVLNELGIYHFDQIASWSEKELNWIDTHLVAFKGRARREKWVEQAKVLAEGGMTEFSKRVKKGEIDRY